MVLFVDYVASDVILVGMALLSLVEGIGSIGL